jgi:predicted Zn-dependent protease
MNRTLFILLFLSLSLQLFAHGDLSMRIAEKTIAISENPNNAELYYERGLLYQEHMEYSDALEDYHKSQALGNTDKAVHYSIAELHFLTEDYNEALKSIGSYLEVDSIDVRAKKLEAQILFQLQSYKKSLEAYRYVIHTMTDIRPEDILEYADIILAEKNKNYKAALEAIQAGLDQLGPHTLSLQLKKLDYLKESDQTEKALEQYNYFILQYNRKEFWYYKKAKYLAEINKPHEAFISLKLAAVAIEQLEPKFKKMSPVIQLKEEINSLESAINNQKS